MSTTSPSSNFLFKSILIGDSNVGKSSFLKQFITGKFSSLHELTIGVELDHKIIQVNNKTINLHLWDTAGLERFHAITINYFKNCAIVFLLFDVCNQSSFQNAFSIWFPNMKKYCHKKTKFILIGTKCDNENARQVYKSEAISTAKKKNMKYIEISSKSGLNVNFAVRTIIKDLLLDIPSFSKEECDQMGILLSDEERLQRVSLSDLHGRSSSCCIIT